MSQNSQGSEILATQIESLTQMDCTQQSQLDELSSTPLSPPAPQPWARLVPCVPTIENPPLDLVIGKSEYWLGRSSARCDIQVIPGTSLSKRENASLAWAHSMISNQHCRIVYLGDTKMEISDSNGRSETPAAPQIVLEDHSGNGTFVNQTVHLKKGHQRMLHSGDEICLVNADTLRKRISSTRVLRTILQQYTYVLVLANKPKRPCVNPRAMNYAGGCNVVDRGDASPRSARRIEAHYEIREILGDGTSGQVRRAIHRETGQAYAVKVISLRRQLDLTSMEHEVNMMQSLDHPYIVQLVDVFVHHGIAMYLVMELVAGGDLFDRIVQQERYSEVDARRVMRRLLSAVYYLHQTKNIVHRDLKPENILCASPTNVKLADFGLAKIIQSDGLKTFCGTPQYFAPEVLQRRTTVAGSGRYGKPADMWSLGVILYILLSGRPPFEADLDPLQAFDAIDFDDPIWKGMPHAQELIQQMLRIDPKRRISVRQACDHPWINAEDGDTHVHPLDDPAVTGRKRLFPESDEKMMVHEGEIEGDSDSTTSKESVLSKEEFAAAATSHQRFESVDFLNVQKIVEEGCPIDEDLGSTVEPSDASIIESNSSKMECTAETPEKYKQKNEKYSGNDFAFSVQKELDVDPVSPTMSRPNVSESPENPMSSLIARELSVTPSEYGDDDPSPRSPLASMDLNERSNRFRAHVLAQQAHKESVVSDMSPSPCRYGVSRNAVTPTASNVGPGPAEKILDEEEICEAKDDPILSQFSCEQSSLESFPDSPVKDALTVSMAPDKEVNRRKKKKITTKKRKRRNVPEAKCTAESSQQPEVIVQNQKQTRQTKLSSWFVSKKQKVETK